MDGGRPRESPRVHTFGVPMAMGRQTTRLVTRIGTRDPSPAHLWSPGKKLALGISSLLISRPSISLRLPPAFFAQGDSFFAHRFMSRKIIKHRSAFPDSYFRRLTHLPCLTLQLFSAIHEHNTGSLEMALLGASVMWRIKEVLSFFQIFIREISRAGYA